MPAALPRRTAAALHTWCPLCLCFRCSASCRCSAAASACELLAWWLFARALAPMAAAAAHRIPCPAALLPCAPCQDPVCTPKGYLFSREAILENLLEQKKVGCDGG